MPSLSWRLVQLEAEILAWQILSGGKAAEVYAEVFGRRWLLDSPDTFVICIIVIFLALHKGQNENLGRRGVNPYLD